MVDEHLDLRAKIALGSIWGVGLVVQLTSAAVADVAGSHAATTVARQTALRFRHSDEVVTDSGLQSVEPPSAQLATGVQDTQS